MAASELARVSGHKNKTAPGEPPGMASWIIWREIWISEANWRCNTTCVYGAPGLAGTVQSFKATYDATNGKLTNYEL